MILRPEYQRHFYSHFPVPNSLTTEEILACISVCEEDEVPYFGTDQHAVTEEFGSAEAFRSNQAVLQYGADILLHAS